MSFDFGFGHALHRLFVLMVLAGLGVGASAEPLRMAVFLSARLRRPLDRQRLVAPEAVDLVQ